MLKDKQIRIKLLTPQSQSNQMRVRSTAISNLKLYRHRLMLLQLHFKMIIEVMINFWIKINRMKAKMRRRITMSMIKMMIFKTNCKKYKNYKTKKIIVISRKMNKIVILKIWKKNKRKSKRKRYILIAIPGEVVKVVKVLLFYLRILV